MVERRRLGNRVACGLYNFPGPGSPITPVQELDLRVKLKAQHTRMLQTRHPHGGVMIKSVALDTQVCTYVVGPSARREASRVRLRHPLVEVPTVVAPLSGPVHNKLVGMGAFQSCGGILKPNVSPRSAVRVRGFSGWVSCRSRSRPRRLLEYTNSHRRMLFVICWWEPSVSSGFRIVHDSWVATSDYKM